MRSAVSKSVYAIFGFDRESELLVREYKFDERLVEELRPLFDVGDDVEMIAWSYPVSEDIKADVSRITGIPLTEDLDYFVESYAAPEDRMP